MVQINDILRIAKLHPERVLNIYVFGSQVYGNASNDSDWDILVIAKTSYSDVEHKIGKLNIHVITADKFQEGLDNNNIKYIECIFAPDWAKIQEKQKFNFNLKLPRLRHSISHVNSNSWVKAKKKMEQGDYYIGIKSLWHSLRIVMFGIQIAKNGKIVDFSCANYIWKDIITNRWKWEELDEKYRSLNNKLLSEFRLASTKN